MCGVCRVHFSLLAKLSFKLFRQELNMMVNSCADISFANTNSNKQKSDLFRHVLLVLHVLRVLHSRHLCLYSNIGHYLST